MEVARIESRHLSTLPPTAVPTHRCAGRRSRADMPSREIKEENGSFRSTIAQLLATLAFSLISTSLGLVLGMPVIVIGALKGEDSPMGLSEGQASWFGSLIYIVQPMGSVLSAFLQDILGRKRCLMLINVPMLAGWIIIYFSTTPKHLYAAIVLMAIAIGFMEAPILSYIGEITEPRLRGVLCSFGGIFYNGGVMIESFLGAALPWRSMVLYSMLGPIAAFTAMSLIPESPPWLVTKGRIQDAEEAYQWLRGWVKPEHVKGELDASINYVKQTQGHLQMKGMSSGEHTQLSTREGERFEDPKDKNVLKKIQEPQVLIAFRIIFIYFFVSACTSLTAMRPFFIEILQDLNLPLKPHVIVAICGGLQMIGAISLGVLMKPLGRRGLSFLSLGVSVLCCLGLTAYLLLDVRLPWLPVILFCISYYCGSLGILPMPWILVTELFPLRARGLGGGLSGAFGYIVMFMVIKTYYSLAALIGVSGVCCLYGVIGILGLVYLYFDMPETEGVALEVIDRQLSERHSIKKQNSVMNGENKAGQNV